MSHVATQTNPVPSLVPTAASRPQVCVFDCCHSGSILDLPFTYQVLPHPPTRLPGRSLTHPLTHPPPGRSLAHPPTPAVNVPAGRQRSDREQAHGLRLAEGRGAPPGPIPHPHTSLWAATSSTQRSPRAGPSPKPLPMGISLTHLRPAPGLFLTPSHRSPWADPSPTGAAPGLQPAARRRAPHPAGGGRAVFPGWLLQVRPHLPLPLGRSLTHAHTLHITSPPPGPPHIQTRQPSLPRRAGARERPA